MPTAMEIYKLLPKTNCGECKFPTCLAFAMQLANQKAALDACPHVSAEAKAALEESGAPPIRLVSFGSGDHAVKMGDETQLFRHDKTFYNPTVLGLVADDAEGMDAIKAKIEEANAMSFERVGQVMKVDSVAIRHSTGSSDDFVQAVNLAASKDIPVTVMCEDSELAAKAVGEYADRRPLLYRATASNLDAMVALAKDKSLPLVVSAGTLEELSDLAEKAKKAGLNDIVLEPGIGTMTDMLVSMTAIRRAAVKDKFRPLGFPTIAVLDSMPADHMKAALGVMKYSSAILMDSMPREMVYPLLALRQNIFTDPQVPIQVKAGLYPVGEPTDKSPVMFTSNFSLTYFTVRADIEKSKLPAWMLVVDTEGQSVMTAFAAGKLTPESVAKAVEEFKVKETNSRNEIIIPGMVSRMSGKLNELTGMKITVGPRESSGLPKMMKTLSA